MSRPTESQVLPSEHLVLRFIPQFLTRLTSFSFSDVAEGASATVLETKAFRQKEPQSDGHLITEDSVLPTTAPGGAPEQNRCYQTPAYFYLFSPLRPLRSRARRTSHRSLRYAPAGGWRFGWCRLGVLLGSSRKVSR